MPTYTKRGLELSVNTAGALTQNNSQVATFADGGFIVVWETSDTAADGSGGAIKAQRFDSAGNKTGGEFLVNSSTATTQSKAAVTTFADGSFAIAWMTDDPLQDGNGRSIKARLFSASGAPTGPEFLVNTATAGNQADPTMVTLANGNFVVSWWEAYFGEVHARIFTADGTALGPDFRVNTNVESLQNSSDISALAGGGFVVTWRTAYTADDGSGESVKGQVFSSTGAKVGGEFLVNSSKFGHQNDPAVAALSGGGFVVTWVTSSADDGNGSAIKAQLFSASGAKVGTEFLVNSAGYSGQEQPAVTSLPDGGFMIAWTTADSAQDGSGSALKAQVFDSAGARVGSEFLVNTQASGNQSVADIATLSDGRVVITWTDANAEGNANWGIKAQILGAGDPPPPPPPPNSAPVITSDGGMASAQRTVSENGSVAAHVTAQDPDGQAVTYSIVGGADAALFTISAQSGVVSFISKPNYEAPGDSDANNRYEIIVSASDGLVADTQILTIAVADVDENVAFTSTNNIFRPENYNAAYMVKAVQPQDPSATITYRLVEGGDADRFALDATTGALTFINSPDYEAPADSDRDNSYVIMVEATDGVTTAVDLIRIHIYDVDEAPVITSGGGGATFALSISENQTAVTTVSATDPENPSPNYAIAGGADAALFTIDARTGELSFIAAPDFEARGDSDGNNVYAVTVSASDLSRSDTQTIFVTITDRDEPIAFVSGGGGDRAAVTVSENSGNVMDLVAVDPDGAAPRYGIAGGADGALFELDPVTRALRFKSLPDHEAPADADGDNVYEVIVGATDGQSFDYQTVSVTVANVYEGVRFAAPSSAFSVDEETAPIGAVSARGEAGAGIVYAIAGGADASRFRIDSATGALAWVAAPDHEEPGDWDGDNVYDLIVSATDGTASASHAVSVTVTDVFEPVEIVSYGGADSVSLTMSEGYWMTGAVVEAVDGEGFGTFDSVVYSITGGADAALFTVDARSGALNFTYAGGPDFEKPADADGDNVYEVVVTASTSLSSDSQAFAITIANLNEGIFITSSGGDSSGSVAVAEGGTAVTVVVADDPDGGPVSFAIAGGADAARFTIDSTTGVLAFVTPPDFERAADSGADNVYEVIVSASDGSLTDTQTLSVTVGNVDEPVEIVSYGGAATVAVSMLEDDFATGVVVEARDPEGSAVTYSITGGADGHSFEIDPTTGALSFTEPNAPDFEDPTDFDSDNVHEVVVTASSSTSSVTQTFMISITNRNEAPWIYYDPNLSVEEGKLEITTVEAFDRDGDVPTYSIVGGADAALFALDPVTNVLSFISARDYERPLSAAGTNVYTVQIEASDGELATRQTLQVTVKNVNEAPAITFAGGGESAAVTVDENGTAVASIAASDVDGDALTYSITGGADGFRFTIDARTGALRFVQAPNFEAPNDAGADNVYDVVVSVTDGAFTDSQAVAVTVRDLAEIVAITSNGGGASASIAVAENGTAVATVAAASSDGGGAATYAITGGADAARFTIDPRTGVLAFVTAPNFEAPADAGANNVYDVVVSASNGATTDTQALAVTVGNVNEQMAIVSNGGGAAAAVSVNENSTVVTTVAGVDPDGEPVTYVILHGGDSERFAIDSATGVLTFRSAPDFEGPGDSDGDNIYNVVVMANDGLWSDTQTISVTVRNIDEAPVITSGGGAASASITVGENGTAVTRVVAGDPDGRAVTYAIAGGSDSARFTIDPATGMLAFVSAPNFEAPGDAGGNNVYDVVVSASDGSFTDTQAIAVTVTNVNEGPAITSSGGGSSGAVSVAENSLTVLVVAATDPEATLVSYSIVGGADAGRFTINAQTGALQFVAAPDWELPGDSDQDNVYSVVVRASDGQLIDDQALNVTVTNVRDGNTVTGTSGGDSISSTSLNAALRTSDEEDLVFGRDGHDSIQGMAGDDEIYGEGGNDTLIGGGGADKLNGGFGKDQFTYNAVSDSTGDARDLIMDFSRSQGDKISLSAIDANSLVSSNQAFTFIGTAAFSNVAGQLRYETSAGVTTVFGDVNGDGVADLQIQLSGAIPLIASDFIL